MRNGLLISAGSLILTFIVYSLIFRFFNKTPAHSLKTSWTSIIKDEEGRYSLSRLQLFCWVFLIFAQQIATILGILSNPNLTLNEHYSIAFSESILLILSLAVTNYVSVKGIAINRINKGLYKKSQSFSIQDIIYGPNGIDFSKFQMLLWTSLALIIFQIKSHYYTAALLTIPNDNNIITQYLPASDLVSSFHAIEGISTQPSESNLPSGSKLPSLSWSFLILMGLSSGTYIGKKLVQPSEPLQSHRENELIENYNSLKADLQFYQDKLEFSKQNKNEHEITECEIKISEIKKTLLEINSSI